MLPANDPPAPRRPIAARLLGIAAALAAAAWIALGWGAADRERAALLDRAAALGLGLPQQRELGRALMRENDRGERRLVTARALLRAAVEAGDGEDERAADQLEAARQLAQSALADLPGSWEAVTIEGGAIALLRIRQRDTRLFSAHQEWEQPLELARARAPGSPEPGRYLAAAYLEVWPALTAEKRATVEPLVRAAFTDEIFFGRMFDRWAKIAGTPERAAELLPDKAETWQRLLVVAARQGDLRGAISLYQRYRTRLQSDLASSLSASALTHASDPTRIVTRAIAQAPRDLAFVPVVERAVAARPPGPVPPELATAAARWVAWAQPLCLLGDCPLSADTFARMASTAGGGLAPDQVAFAELAAGDRPRAELLARRSDSLWSELWGPYVLLSARQHLEQGESAQACAELAQVHHILRSRAPFRLLARACGASFAGTGSEPVERASWSAGEWVWSQGIPSLSLVAERSARALELALREPQSGDALLVVEWDGAELPPLVLAAGGKSLRIPVEVSAGAHLVRLSARVGPLPSPGTAALE